MKKSLSVVAAVMILTLSAAPVLAYGGSHHGVTRTVSYSVCTTKSCIQTGVHSHSGITYTSHYYGDGHDYHEYCNLTNCMLTGYHEHDGSYCFGHTLNDGHSCHHTSRAHH